MNSVVDDDSAKFGAEMMKLGSHSLTHCCDRCGKGFGSGKALGGHLRIHRSSARHRPWRSSSSVSIACRVCGKKFPSLKSVFGHMRAHRGSRPMQPPPATFSGDQVPNSSSSTVSKNNDNQMHGFDAAAVAGPSSSSDLTKSLSSLSGWSVTAKRGTTQAKKQRTVTCQELNSRLSDKQCLIDVHGDFFSRKIRDKGTIGEGNPKIETRDLLSSLLNNKVVEELGSTEDIILQRKLKKSRRLSELGPKSITPPHAAAAAVLKKTSYSCNICGVSFPTHQALGGHVSRHKRKLRISTAPSQTTGSKFLMRFDLNEMPPLEDR